MSEISKTPTSVELCNQIRRVAEHVDDTGFPIDAFPQAIQSIILDWAKYDNYLIEYSATAMLSAIATAIGNSLKISPKGSWESAPSLYFILVGRPGIGKTAPLEAAYLTIKKYDMECLKKYKAEMEVYEASKSKDKGKGEEDNGMNKPVLVNTVVSDFTPEALMKAHDTNPRGVVILVDEIIGFFNSVNRYNQNALIEQLTSCYSGSMMKITRASIPIPIVIEHPCINIIGTTQTRRMHEMINKGFEDSGFLDRMMFTYPRNQKISPWLLTDEDSSKLVNKSKEKWNGIVKNVFSIPFEKDEKTGDFTPKVLLMDKEAMTYFYTWRNNNAEISNANQDTMEENNREPKVVTNVARLALVIQVMRWACGESHINYVDITSVKSAILLNAYFEDCLQNIKTFMRQVEYGTSTPEYDVLGSLKDEFTTQEAITTIRKCFNIQGRSAYMQLSLMIKNKLIEKISHGRYKKVVTEKPPNITVKENEENKEPENQDTANCNE